MAYDPIELTKIIKKVVNSDDKRKYYRVVRGGRWYGGIATADCCGCNLRCIFCWSNAPRDNPETIGKFYEPDEVVGRLTHCARKNGYNQLRISGNEPTLNKEHLLKVLKLLQDTKFLFILETNGTLIDEEYARVLSQFKRVHVRVSLKGTDEEEFGRLTGARSEFFNLQINGLKNLVAYKVRCHPAVMLSFSPKVKLARLKERLRQIAPILADNLEEEYLFLYPHVQSRLAQAKLEPLIAYEPDRIPKELV